MQVQPSLGTPLQVESSPESQVSLGLGATLPEHAPHVPPTHCRVPFLQFPVADPHASCAPSRHGQPSLATPSQSESSPAVQVSAPVGSTLPSQGCQTPSAQVCVPWLQLPIALPHGRVAPFVHEQPSFGMPLQLESSSASHVSFTCATTWPTHSPQADPSQLWTPFWQPPSSVPHARSSPWVHEQPSLRTP